jgi:hypothetical protein
VKSWFSDKAAGKGAPFNWSNKRKVRWAIAIVLAVLAYRCWGRWRCGRGWWSG